MYRLLLFLLFVLASFLTAEDNLKNNALYNKATELSKKILIIDTHVDIPYRIKSSREDISVRTENGHFDYVRAIEGGLNSAFMSIFVPAKFEETGGSYEFADTLIDMIEEIGKNYPDKFVVAYSTEDVLKYRNSDVVTLPMGMENGSPIEGSVEKLKHFHKRGIRYITLAHGKANHICDSSYDPNRKWNGLSPFGKTLIHEMNNLGVMVDISHVSDSTFYQVMELTQTPVIASHSSCRHFTPGFERNMDDDMIKKLAENNGVIQITFGSYFISEDFQSKMSKMEKYLKEHNISRWGEEGKKYYEEFIKENSIDFGSTKTLVDHIEHVIKLVGIDYVGLGSDFDGIGALPVGIKDVSSFPEIIYELLVRGYKEDDIEKICSGNILRVWKEVENFAKAIN
jgi:membrane dipeptidase